VEPEEIVNTPKRPGMDVTKMKRLGGQAQLEILPNVRGNRSQSGWKGCIVLTRLKQTSVEGKKPENCSYPYKSELCMMATSDKNIFSIGTAALDKNTYTENIAFEKACLAVIILMAQIFPVDE